MKKTAAKKTVARKGAPLPFEIHATRDQPLGMPVERFLRTYWHKHPLLIRNAFPDFQSPLQPEDLAGLACEDGVLARLISHDRAADDWTVRTGPFQETDFPGLPDHDWTLLVQDVDKWDADVRALLEQFRFLPRWRIDDIMISFAATGGSVGAHVDHYDVFLLQGLGHRRWQVDARTSQGRKPTPLAFRDDVDIKLLREFKPTHDWVLGPGDMLYLPPLVPHHGVAQDACLTFSIGTRAPSSAELIGDYLDTLIADADEAVRYHDEDLKVPADPYEIDVTAMNRVVAALNALRMNDPDRLGDWFGRFMTTYRASGDVVPAPEPIPREAVEQALDEGVLLHRHPWSRLAWRRAKRGATLFCSGLEFALSVKDASRLAAAEEIDGALYGQLSVRGREVVLELLAQGHYQRAHEDQYEDLDDDNDAHTLSLSADHLDNDEDADLDTDTDATQIDADADVEAVADEADQPDALEEAEDEDDNAEAAADTGMANDASATQEDDAANPADDDALHNDEDPQHA
ncbi:cupin domain-containing protein [Xanthomonas campestris]|uniref:ribosomal protein uL16 3-hydroxylase n=1 Tax=Xanthomonas campestris TaxID=339 RepID=UPI001E5C6BEE|nr:cupin domain-containing protein [Xanthomonas campestris]MCC5062364.1 cupin domain-containing protein [Xanthomonas campestris pv. raphani]MEA9887479.1 cupin domain-containing protein [Xanthomonas campestris pv. raphani]MEA9971993.1 cupin domain-containing protein [Xanthomonas campestris pv. raphani]